jgi:hypothetical protein
MWGLAIPIASGRTENAATEQFDLLCDRRTYFVIWNIGQGAKRHAHRGDSRFAVCEDGAKRGQRGYNAGKKIKGRKRHIAVDTQGHLLAAVVHSAGIQDRVAARAVLMRLFRRFDTITTIFADGGYTRRLDRLGKKDVRVHPADRQTHRPERLPSLAKTLDRRAHLRVAQLVQKTLRRLRSAPHLSRN